MGFFDVLFGEAPSQSTQTLDTLTPEQQQALNQILSSVGGNVSDPRRFGGNVNVGLGDTAETSLAGLENRASVLADPTFQSDISKNAQDTLFKLLDFEGSRTDIDDVFTKTVQDPLVEDFTESILPQIGRSFGGSNFFSGERARADDEAREDLLTGLSRSRSDFSFKADESAKNRALAALGIAPELEGQRTDELLSIFGAGMEETGLEERNVSRQFQQFLAEAGLEQNDINALLQAIGIPAIENVVTTSGGSSGLLGPLLASAANPIGSFLSSFLGDGKEKEKDKDKPTGMSPPDGGVK
jgi:hypothetical protein